MKKKKRRIGEGAVALAACVAILLLAWGVAMAVVMGNPQLMQFLMGEMFGHGAASFPENSLYYSRASAAAQVRLPPLDNLHLLHYNL